MSIPTSRTRTQSTRRLNAAAVTFLLLAAPLALLLSMAAPVAAGTLTVSTDPFTPAAQTSSLNHVVGAIVTNTDDLEKDPLSRAFVEVEFTAGTGMEFDNTFTGSNAGSCDAPAGWTLDAASDASTLIFTGKVPKDDSVILNICFDTTDAFTDDATVNVKATLDITKANDLVPEVKDLIISSRSFTVKHDTTPPTLLSLTTQDSNQNGHLDAIRATFSEEMADAGMVSTEWSVSDGYTVSGITEVSPSVFDIVLDEKPATDTGATPTVTYTPGGATDVARHALPAVTNEPTDDKAVPVITQRGVSIDGTSIVVKFSEPVYTALSSGKGVRPVVSTDFAYGNVGSDGATQNLAACVNVGGGSVSNSCHTEGGDTVVLTVTEKFVKEDENDTLCVKSADAVYDFVGNPAPLPPSCAGTLDLFGIEPGTIETVDGDKDGYIDAVTLTFTIEPDPATHEADDWDVVDYDEVSAILTGSTLTITLQEGSGLGDTDAAPQVTYTASGARLTANGIPGAALVDQDLTAKDAAVPVLMHVQGLKDTRFAKAVFSEGVYGNYNPATSGGGPSKALTKQDGANPAHFDYNAGADGGNGIFDDGTDNAVIAGITHAEGGRVVTLELSAKLDNDDLLGAPNGDALAPRQSGGCDATADLCVYDAVGNFASTTPVPVQSFNGLPVSSIETVDGDGDGLIDGLRVLFDRAVDDSASTFLKNEWKVEGYTVTAVGTGAAVDDNAVLLTVAEGATLDTGATPRVSYAYVGGIFDADGEALIPFAFGDKATTDKAKPILVGAFGNPGSDLLRLEFSEPVQGTGGGFAIHDIQSYTDGSESDAAGYFQFTEADGSDGVVTLQLDVPLGIDDLGDDSITLHDGSVDSNFAVRDLASNLLHPDTVTAVVSDVDAPSIVSVTTLDADGNGGIEGLRITFDEPMDDANLGEAGLRVFMDDDSSGAFETGEYEFTIVADSLVVGDSDTVLEFQVEERKNADGDLVGNSDSTPTLSYDSDGGTLVDASGNALGDDVVLSQDTVGPRVVSAVTKDLDGDGYVDAYLVTFNEDVQGMTAQGWRVGVKFPTVEHPYDAGSGVDDSLALLEFGKIGTVPDTGLKPHLTYDGTGTVKDGANIPMVAFGNDGVVETDGAAPILWKVLAEGGDNVVMAYFTEAVDNGASPAGRLTRFSFDYADVDNDGAGAITGVAHTVGTSQVSITLDAPLTAADIAGDLITIKATSAYDAADNVATVTPLLSGFTDGGGAPYIVSVKTQDVTGDGMLDAVVVQFNEDLKDSTFPDALTDWDVDGYTINAVSEDTGKVTLSLDPLSVGDTGETPAVSFLGASPDAITDLAGNAWDPTSAPILDTTDAAAPVLLSVSGGAGFGFLHLRFSEAVFADDDGTGALDPTAFAYVDTSQNVRKVDEAHHVAGDALVRLDLDTVLAASDLNSDTAAAVAGRVFGLEGLSASAAVKQVTAFDGPVPDGVAATIDSDKNGHIDAIRVTFDAPISDGSSTFDASHWTVGAVGHGIRPVVGVATGIVGVTPNQAGDKVVYVLLGESAQPDTDATFTLQYNPVNGGLVGADGAPVAAYTAQQVADKAGPVVVRATGNPGSEFVTVTFSEVVFADNTATPSSVLTKQLIQYIDNGGGPAPSGLSEADAGDKKITIEMAGALLFSDLGSDKVSLVATKTWDAAGNSGVAFSRALSDVSAPGIESVKTVDGDGNGWIDGLLVTLDESYDPASLSPDGFSLAGAYADVEVLDATVVDAKAFLLTFAELPSVDDDAEGGDTAVKPNMVYDAVEGSLTDLSAVAMASFTWTQTVDGAAPAIVEARTVDDGDGVLDAYEVTFSELVQVGSDHTLWSIGGVAATGTVTTSVDRLLVFFDAAAVKAKGIGVGTGDTPELAYDADSETPDITDLANHPLPDILAAAPIEADGALPILQYLSVQPGSKTAKAVFSEGVDSGFGGTPGPLTKGSFAYSNDNSACTTCIVSVSHTAGASFAMVQLKDAVVFADLTADKLALASATSAYDAAGLPAGTGPADLVDLTEPSVSTVTTADIDQDGRIDRIHIDFDEAIDFSNLEAADFTVLLYTVEETTSTFGHRLTLQLKEEETRDHDTGITPQVAYDASKGTSKLALTDVSLNAFRPADTPIPATTDGAAPVLVSAKAVDTDVVQARFSEAVQAKDASGAAVVLGSSQFNYDDGAGDSGNTISVVSHRLGDRTAGIALERDLEAKDRTTDTTSTFQDRLSPVDVFDAAGLRAVAADNTPVYVFGGPMLTAIQTVGDGTVEYLEVLFSGPVKDAKVAESIALGQWSTSIGSITGMKTSLETTVPAGDVDDDTVYLQMASGITDTGARPLVSYTGTTVVDESGEPLQKFSAHLPRDGIVPKLLKVETVDDEDFTNGADRTTGDGFLDALLVTVSEAVDDGTLDYGKWTVTLAGKTLVVDAAASAAANAATDQVDDDKVLLVLADQGSLDTSKTPAVTYAGGIKDLAGHILPAFTTPRTSLDAAAPVLVSATSPATGQKQVILTFSEAVKGSGTSNAVVVADLKYTDHATDPFNKGATKIASLTHSGATVTATLDKDFSAADHLVDTVQAIAPDTASAVGIKDAAGVGALETPVLLATDVEPPAAVTNLAAASPTGNSVTLTFTAVADDANHAASGAATSYQVRHHSSAITESNWASATPATFSATPGAPGAAESVQVTGLETETTYHFALRAVDDAGNVGGVSNSDSATTLADGTPPTGALAISSSTHTSGVASPATSAVLTWAGISDAESSITYRFKVSSDAAYAVTSSDDAVTGTSIPLSSLTDGARYVHLKGFSAGGPSNQATFHVVTDTVAPAKITDLAAGDKGPLSITLTWKAPGDDGSSGTAKDYQLYRSESAFTAGGLADVPLVSGVVAPAAAGTAQSFEVTGLSPDTEYHFAIRARDDAGNAGALSSVVVASTDPDTTAPVGELGLRSSSHLAGAKSNLRDLAFGWDAATDAESDVFYRYALVEDDGYALSDADETTDGTSIDFDGVEPGTWTFLVAAESDGGRGATGSFQVVLLGLSDEDLEDANKEVVTKVTRKGDTNVVTWTLPAGTPADVEGVQVLRSNSPYRVVATIPADSEEFAQGSFVDDTDGAEADSSYLVTMYYGESASLGKQPEGQDLLLSEPLTAIGATPAPEVSASVFGHAAFYLGLLAVLAIVGFAIAAVVMHGQRRPQPAREQTSREASA